MKIYQYSKTVLRCKENCRYEMSVKKIVFRGRNQRFSGNLTLFCYYYIPHFTYKSRINGDLLSEAKWAGSDVTARLHVISFSNTCELIPQPEVLENVSRVIIHYLNELIKMIIEITSELSE